MTDRDTTELVLETLRLSNQEGYSQRQVGSILGISKSTVGNILRGEVHQEVLESLKNKPIASGDKVSPDKKRKKLKGKRFVFTSAQNNTFVHTKFLQSLEVYCEHNNAELIVGTYHYNKTGFQNAGSEDLWYDPKIRKYILDESCEVFEGLLWCGELNILPTAVNPLSGFHSYTQSNSGIVPHAKVQLESLPSPKGKLSRQLFTTGTVTQLNYVDMKAGQKAAFHHVFGAVVAEVDEEGDWFVRQLIAESCSGKFQDLDKLYTPTGVEGNKRLEAVNYGDIHVAKLDPMVAKCSWEDEDSILKVLKPKYQFLHDVYDHKNRNHHNVGDPYFLYKMYVQGTESVEDELKDTTEVMKTMQQPYSNLVVVESNHDLALQRWLKEQDYKKDPVNAELFLELQLATYKAIKGGEDFSVFEYACKTLFELSDNTKFLRTDESFVICGDIECGSHGHNGNNGGRGSVRAFQMLGIRTNTGHTHSPTIKDGAYIAGVSGKLDMGYNVGGSSWAQAHILTYPNGKRSMVFIKNGKWRV